MTAAKTAKKAPKKASPQQGSRDGAVGETPAKTKNKPKDPLVGDGPITVSWHLGELPSAQHRAGLAGLVLVVQWLCDRERKLGDSDWVCSLSELTESSATLRVDRAGMRVLFDNVFAASEELKPQPQVRKHPKTKKVVPPKETRELPESDKDGKPALNKDGSQKLKKYYFYPVIIPRGAVMLDADPLKEKGLWIKLWRDFLWTIVRGVPTTRAPYEERKDGSAYTVDADAAFDTLALNRGEAVPLKSTHYLGAQDTTADNVAFCDRDTTQFLLVFSSFAVGLYVPLEFVRPDDTNRQGTKISNSFAVIVPDVAQLKSFCSRYRSWLFNRSSEKTGYRPREAVVDLTTVGALEMHFALRERVKEKVAEADYAAETLGFEVIHVAKEGNNVRVYSTERFEPTSTITSEYPQVRNKYWDPYFRRQRLINLLKHRPWHHGFDAIAETVDCSKLFIGSTYFRKDAALAFKKENSIMTDSKTEASLEDTVRNILKDYVKGKQRDRSLPTWDDLAKDQEAGRLSKDKIAKYDESVERWTRDAFLAIRARRNRSDFVEYFVGSLCAGTHGLAAKRYALLHEQIKKDWRTLRTITLLACAAVPHWYEPKASIDATNNH
jgi:CRISPR-associated protein Cmx8